MATKSKKVENYTPEQVAQMTAEYCAADSDAERAVVVADLAETMGKSAASIRAKLVREGVYVAKTYKTKTGGKAESKEEIVQAIAHVMGISSEMLVGLEKANKATLNRVRDALADKD